MELFERIRYISTIKDTSLAKIAKALGVPQQTFHQWLKAGSQKNLWEHLPKIQQMFPDIRREWLWWGEGDMQCNTPGPCMTPPKQHPPVEDALSPPKPAQAIPLIGFAGCSTMGWHGSMTYPIAATAPHARPGMIAVMASGESMLPAGIGHGHICFCDPSAEPLPGECVYVACHDNKHTLKTFLGWGGAEGHKIHEGELVLRGWLDKQESEQQKDIVIHINRNLVKVIAPVVYVQRRL